MRAIFYNIVITSLFKGDKACKKSLVKANDLLGDDDAIYALNEAINDLDL